MLYLIDTCQLHVKDPCLLAQPLLLRPVPGVLRLLETNHPIRPNGSRPQRMIDRCDSDSRGELPG